LSIFEITKTVELVLTFECFNQLVNSNYCTRKSARCVSHERPGFYNCV